MLLHLEFVAWNLLRVVGGTCLVEQLVSIRVSQCILISKPCEWVSGKMELRIECVSAHVNRQNAKTIQIR